MFNLKVAILFSICLSVFASCSYNEEKQLDPLVENIDIVVSPKDNFFRYANGKWIKNNPISSSDVSNGIWKLIGDTINNQIKEVCEKSAAIQQPIKGSAKQKIGDFYSSGMDTLQIEKEGLMPLKNKLADLKSIKDSKTLIASIADLYLVGCNPAFTFYVAQDDKISSKYAINFSQGGLSLGERDYYLNSDKRTLTIKKSFEKHVASMLTKIGYSSSQAKNNAKSILMIETRLAENSRSLEDMRNPLRNYNKMTLNGFSKITPSISWTSFLSKVGLNNTDTIIVRQPEFFLSLEQLIKSVKISDWKVYLEWNLINSYAPYLSKDFRNQDFKFYSTEMNGVSEQKPRWETIVDETNNSLGDLIGQVYVKEYLPKGSKEKLLEIGNAIREVYAVHIKKLDWMSDVTKKKALKKLDRIVMKVGYPDVWRDMSKLSISRNSFCSNIMAKNRFEFQEMIARFGKKVDKSRWEMTPQTYNAYYDPSNNEIVVPACNIIVPGFEGRMPDDAILYGIIGSSVFGHEITHGFDDEGCQFDENGNLNNWWTDEDYSQFKKRTKLIVDQFNSFTVLKNKHVNGEATQGENIADLGGLVMGLEAFKKTKQFKSNQVINGQKPLNRFFLSYAYAWMINFTDEGLLNKIMTDVHAPAEFRVLGPLSNMKEFYDLYKVKKGDNMYLSPDKRVSIW